MKRSRILLSFALLAGAQAQTGYLAEVVAKPVARIIELPGEFQPFLSVSLHARVTGYVEKVLVDRGSAVKQGDLLVELSAPEMQTRIAEAESKVQEAESEVRQAEAQLAAVQATYTRLKQAAETPGAVAGNEVVQQEKQVEAAQAVVRSRQQAIQSAKASVQSLNDLLAYLKITAPFDGVVTDRMVHPGALVGPGADPALLVIQQISHLRLVVAVPEENVGAIARGASVLFHVPAYPERSFSGTVARISHAIDPKSRTMPVELDVVNRGNSLSPGMYPTVKWPVRRARPSLLVPKTAVVTTTERTFVIRDQQGRAEWVDVKKGEADGDLIEVMGPLKPGDRVLRRGSDEVREGAALQAKGK
jgi:RND family efflux transporter MFP subunit